MIYNQITIEKNVPAVMRDGITLMANIYRPAQKGSFPVLLTRLPYGKDLPLATSYIDPVKAAQHGYIVVIQDVRGRFQSKGDWIPFQHEFTDGYDTVEWAAKLPDADGRVATWGLSYFGMTQWQAAVMNPPSLKTMVLGTTWGNYLNGTQMRGGARELGLINHWSFGVLSLDSFMKKYGANPQELAANLPNLVGLIDNIPDGYDVLPLTELPDPYNLIPYMYDWFDRPIDDPYWEQLNLDGRYADVRIPQLHIGGWYDIFLGETIKQYMIMKAQAKQFNLTPPRMVIGPWVHGNFSNIVGELNFGLASSGMLLNYRGDLTDLHLRWYDAILNGNEEALNGQPPVQVFVMGENRWRGYDEWPISGANQEKWYFHSEGHANTRFGNGKLSRVMPSQEPCDRFVYDPKNPVPTIGGALLMPGLIPPGAHDQRSNEERNDVLVYTSDILEEDYTAIGAVAVDLFAASSAPDTDFVARLVDVYPDGRAINVTDGIIRASARESYPAPGVIRTVKPSLIEPDRVYHYIIDLWATGLTFKAGHRIRVEITSSNFPRWERNLNTGQDSAHSEKTQIAEQHIFHDADHPSAITLHWVKQV